MDAGADGAVVGLRLAATKKSNLDEALKVEIMRSFSNSGVLSELAPSEGFTSHPSDIPSVEEVSPIK